MVMNDEGQLYTIEGITAGIIMLITAYAVFSTGFVFTPGDAHIADMQLQQLGYDALLMMDTPDQLDQPSMLELIVASNKPADFTEEFNNLLVQGTGSTQIVDSIRWNARLYYHDSSDGKVRSLPFGPVLSEIPNDQVSNYDSITREPAISVTRFVHIKWDSDSGTKWPNKPISYSDLDNGASLPGPGNKYEQMVLLEVLLWRG